MQRNNRVMHQLALNQFETMHQNIILQWR